jgi:hypothetical protein
MLIIETLEASDIAWAIARSQNPSLTKFTKVWEMTDLEVTDFQRAIRLGQAQRGSGHDCFLKGVTVKADIYCPRRMQTQLIRYRFLDVVSAMSVEKNTKDILYDNACWVDVDDEVKHLLRLRYEEHKDLEYIRNHIPASLVLGISFKANYLQLKTIVAQRKNHRLPEWREFCGAVMELPMFAELTGSQYEFDGKVEW